jgi:Cupin-like domain
VTAASGGQPIERIDTPIPGVLDRDYLRRPQPVIIRGALEPVPGMPRIGDRKEWRDHLADLPLLIRSGSVAELLLTGGASGEPLEQSTFAAFCDHLRDDPASQRVCAEFPVAESLMDVMPTFPYLNLGDAADVLHQMFLAGPSGRAQFHYDGDLRHVLMLQVFGRKRYVLVHPRHSDKLLPITEARLRRTSGVLFGNLGEADQQAFLSYTEAYSCDLEPGEVLLMPAGWWHYVQYHEVSFSVAIRLGRNRLLRFLAEQIPVPSVEWLVLAQCCMDEDAVDPNVAKALAALERAASGEFANKRTRELRLEQMCAAISRELALPTSGPPATAAGLLRLEALNSKSGPQENERRLTPPASLRAFTSDSPVALVEGAQLVVPMIGEGLMLALGDRLVASISPDPAHPWTMGLLARIARRPNLNLGELAAGAGADEAVVATFLGQLSKAGWLKELP